jgi:hypothetical protein
MALPVTPCAVMDMIALPAVVIEGEESYETIILTCFNYFAGIFWVSRSKNRPRS